MASCPCVKVHVPKPAYLQTHHIVPLAWGGANTPENLIAICGTQHDAVHDLLNRYVRSQGRPFGPGILSRYPRFARHLAARALAGYGGVPHVYTTSVPGGHDA